MTYYSWSVSAYVCDHQLSNLAEGSGKG